MDEKKYYLSLNVNKWSDLETNDLFSRIHLPLNKIGRSIGFCLIYENLNDALKDNDDLDKLVEITINSSLHSKKSDV